MLYVHKLPLAVASSVKATMVSSDADKEWELVLETLNVALKATGSASGGSCRNIPEAERTLCGQAARVMIPDKESAQTMSILRQLLLREIDKEVKALDAP